MSKLNRSFPIEAQDYKICQETTFLYSFQREMFLSNAQPAAIIVVMLSCSGLDVFNFTFSSLLCL